MAAIILPHQWTRQPQIPVGVDWGNPLTNKLKFATIPGVALTNATQQSGMGTRVNAPTNNVDKYGKRVDFVAASSQYIDYGSPPDITGDMTVLCWYVQNSLPTTGYSSQLVARDNNTGNRSYTFDIGNFALAADSGLRFYVNGGGSLGVNHITEQRKPIAGDDRMAVAVWSPSTNYSALYANNVGVGLSTAVTNPPTANNNLWVGARQYAGFQEHLDGSIRLVCIWARRLLAAEIAALYTNPWQIFAPLPRRMWLGVGTTSGGSVYNPYFYQHIAGIGV